jgi:hypothetical protein
MSIDITSLFADILPDPAKERQQRGNEQANMLSQMGAVGASLAPERAKALRLGGGGMFGLDTRTESEHIQDELKALGQPETMSEHKAYADLLDKLRAGSGVQYMMKVGENNRLEKEAETRRLVAENKKKADEAAAVNADEVRHPVFSDTWANGTTIRGSDDGVTRVHTPEGKLVTGVEAAEVINEANAFDLEQAMALANQNEDARRRGEQMEIAYETVASLRVENASLDDALEALDEGAYTGTWSDLVPTFTNAQAKLKQAQNELGLSVIGGTTFGSLSEAEMKMALETALPTKMVPEALAGWVKERVALNNRLMNDMNEYMVYTVNGGSEAGWLVIQGEMRRQRAEEQEAADAAALDKDNSDLLNQMFPDEDETPTGTQPANTGDRFRRNR